MSDKAQRPDIGGQAVLEGVMMKSPEAIAIAVRKPNGEIVLKRDTYKSPASKHRWMGLPIIRGVVNMGSMLALGIKTLDDSTKMLGLLDEEEPSKFEAWMTKKLGKGAEKLFMGVTIAVAIALSVFLFMVIPSFVASLVNNHLTSSLLVVNLASGVARIIILVLYIGLSGLIPDMRRTYQYHGAEHKTVYCHENEIPLTPENAKRFSPLHPRCGTSFLLLVMIIAIVLGAIFDEALHLIFSVGKLPFGWRILRSIAILPLIAGISYEALKALAHSNHWVVRALRWPGLKLQRLTTREPDEAQLEVAIAAFNAALHGLPAKEAQPEATETAKAGEANEPQACAE